MLSKVQLKRYFFIFVAVNLIGVAVALILESGLGCDPIGLLCDGVSKFFSIQFGIASFYYNVGIIGLALLLAKKSLGMGTISYGLLSGFFIDFYRMIFINLGIAEMGMTTLILAFIIGEVCMSLAFAILMQLDLGMTALDAVLVKIKGRLNIPYSYVKIATDILLVLTGTLLGGVFGIGTIISALVTGILVERLGKVIKRVEENFKRIEVV